MADEQEHQATSRFRLPRLFSHPSEASGEMAMDDAAELPSTREEIAPQASGSLVVGPFVAGSVVAALAANKNKAAQQAKNAPNTNEVVVDELAALREAVEGLSEQITQVNHRESSMERVFDALHAELADYKKDFLYEHLKPVVRPLLFLFDSLEQFEAEVAAAENEAQRIAAYSAKELLPPSVVRENVQFFRDQLAEALQVCEVTIMETPSGAFNAKVHRAVDVAPVAAEADGTIVRVVRSGWYLNGQLLRPAEVVVGKFRG